MAPEHFPGGRAVTPGVVEPGAIQALVDPIALGRAAVK
jgi:hypothetical protein